MIIQVQLRGMSSILNSGIRTLTIFSLGIEKMRSAFIVICRGQYRLFSQSEKGYRDFEEASTTHYSKLRNPSASSKTMRGGRDDTHPLPSDTPNITAFMGSMPQGLIPSVNSF